MSVEHPPYNQLYIKAWTLLAIITALVLLGMFIFGDQLIYKVGLPIWSLLRWLASPII